MKFYSFSSESLPVVELPEQKLEFNKIPFDVIYDAIQFLRTVFMKQKTESGTVIVLDRETGLYGLTVPKGQKASYTSLDWKNGIDESGMIGTIHSHCDFNGTFSQTDLSDQKHIPGIHFVFGDLDRENFPSYGCQIVVTREHILNLDKDFKMEDVVDDWEVCKWQLGCPQILTYDNVQVVEEEKFKVKDPVGFSIGANVNWSKGRKKDEEEELSKEEIEIQKELDDHYGVNGSWRGHMWD